MNIQAYQDFTETTFIKSGAFEIDLAHVQNGLQAEAGEVAAAYQKYYRGDYDEHELHRRLIKELGGLMYYICRLADMEGMSMAHILDLNMSVLKNRKKNNTLMGDGDDR